jgi:hypothetical protein
METRLGSKQKTCRRKNAAFGVNKDMQKKNAAFGVATKT